MPAAITFKITDAGRAALRNADGNGTNAVLVTSVGITATAFAPGDPLPNELKRLTTIKGGATAADTIHVTISDDTQGAVYEVRGYGLYLQDGTMLGSYGQADVIVQKSAQAAMLLSADIQFADIDATQITFGDTNFSNPAATTERMGVVELATDDETVSGTDSTRAITPKGLLATLNARLGAAAPTTFVKTLLTVATAAAFRVALGIKSAGTYDTGADNGLDADKLDGQHGSYYQAWANLTGVPATFTSSPHKHDAGDITSGVLPVARGGTGGGAFALGNFIIGADGAALTSITPAQTLTAIGAAAKKHSHEQADIIGLTDALTSLQTGVDGRVKKAGDTMTGDLSISKARPGIILTKANGNEAYLIGLNGDKARWSVILGDKTVESGTGNTGSDFQIQNYNDAGALLGIALKLRRSDSGLEVGGPIQSSSNFVTSGTAWVGAPGQAGAMYFRPNGIGSLAGSWALNSEGGYISQVAGGYVRTPGLYGRAAFEVTYSNTGEQGIGGAWATWTTDRYPAMQVAAQTPTAAYMIWRATRWGGRHIAAQEAYENSGNAMIGFHAGNTLTHIMTQDGNFQCNGMVTATGGFNVSDRREKKNIKRIGVTRGIADYVAQNLRCWNWKSNGRADRGVIAQTLQRFAPHWVMEFERPSRTAKDVATKVKRLSVDKAGLALECALDNTLTLQELVAMNAALVTRLDRLERNAV